MDNPEKPADRRAEIARRSLERKRASRLRTLTMTTFGLMAYSAFANILGGLLLASSIPTHALYNVILGGLFAFGAYRVWARDDIRWWPVAVPAALSTATLLLALIHDIYRLVPLLINIALIALVAARRRTSAATANPPSDPTR